MGRSAIPHVVLAIAALICGTVLACLGHPNESYVAFGLVGVGGVAAAAVTVPAGTPGTPEASPLGALAPLLHRAMAELNTPGSSNGSAGGAANTPPPPPADVTPPPPAPLVTS